MRPKPARTKSASAYTACNRAPLAFEELDPHESEKGLHDLSYQVLGADSHEEIQDDDNRENRQDPSGDRDLPEIKPGRKAHGRKKQKRIKKCDMSRDGKDAQHPRKVCKDIHNGAHLQLCITKRDHSSSTLYVTIPMTHDL